MSHKVLTTKKILPGTTVAVNLLAAAVSEQLNVTIQYNEIRAALQTAFDMGAASIRHRDLVVIERLAGPSPELV